MPNIFTLTAPSIGYKKSISINIIEKTTFTIAYVLPDGNFKGGYGIDWCEIKDAKIERFQDVKPSEISHIFDETSNTFISDGITEDKREELIKALYATTKINEKGLVKETAVDAELETAKKKDKLEEVDYIPTWINLPEGETVKVEVKLLVKGEERKNGYITFKKNKNFEITKGKDQDDNIRLEKLENGKSHSKIYIKALTTFSTPQDIILVDDKGIEVGKIEMEANNIVELGVRIIPIVIASTNKDAIKKKEAELKNAISLRETALKATEKDNKLNERFAQAGIKCNIEPAKDPELEYILIDPNDKKDKLAGHYDTVEIVDKNAPKPTGHAGGTVPIEYKEVGTLDKDIIDDIMDVYKERFDPTSSYKGAILFVTDQYNPKTTVGGASSTLPIEFQGVVIYTTTSDVGIEDEGTYVHELGHMLGLGHTFVEDEDISQDEEDKKTVIGKLKNIKEDVLYEKETIDTYTKKIEQDKKYMAEHPLNDSMSSSEKDSYKEAEKGIETSKKILDKAKEKLKKAVYEKAIVIGSDMRIKKEATKNYMDYDNNKTYFQRYQAKLVKEEVSKYYA